LKEERHIWSSLSVKSSSVAAPYSDSGQEDTSATLPHPANQGDRLAEFPERHTTDPPNEWVRPTLVVVDDERDVLSSIRDLLRIDYRVITYERGQEALEYLRSGQAADVILCDQRMPELTGVEVLRQAKAIRPETTRLLFTAYSDIRTVIDAVNQGHVFRYLGKPCEPDELAAVVRQALEHHNLIVEKSELLAELRESNQKLIEANRLKGAFIEVASHELNTPVTVVLGMLELWKMSQSPTASPQERQWVDRIGAAAARLARTVERMLKLVRNRDFSQSLDRQPTELEPLVQQAIDELAPYLELRSLAVSVSVDSNLGSIDVDQSKIADVLTNLFANAVKFTPDGGTIRFEARAEPTDENWVRISVRDEGAGVAEADQQHLFEPFFTGFDTLRHSSGDYQFGKRGIGLGLWLVKTFVELHGGRVEVSSSPGAGSTFAFVLPRSAAILANETPDQHKIPLANHTRDATRPPWPAAV
jgi:signal transduction histidine kinase